MKVKKVSIYIRLCDQQGRPFKRLKVRNPQQCRERDYYFLRVGGKFEFFAEDDAARKDLNEALHGKGERDHELPIGVAAPIIPQRTAAQPDKTPVVAPCRSTSTTSRQWARTKRASAPIVMR